MRTDTEILDWILKNFRLAAKAGDGEFVVTKESGCGCCETYDTVRADNERDAISKVMDD